MALPLPQLLKIMVDEGGTDLHITTNSPPIIRVHGTLRRIEHPSLSPAETKQVIYSILNDTQKYKFEENWELDFSFGIKGIARFRANVFMQRGAVAGAFRRIPYEIWTFEKLGTVRHRIIQRAVRLIRPQGELTLTMSANPDVRKDLLHFLDVLQKAA